MIDIKKRMQLFKFLGEMMSDPSKFNQHVVINLVDHDDGRVSGSFVASGPVAEFLRGHNVQKAVEKKR